MRKVLHPVAGGLALLMILTFWAATVVSELSGAPPAIVAVKTAIAWALIGLIPALAAAGGTGFALAKGRDGGLVRAKRRRMPFIAANGLLVLVPAALFLAVKAGAGELDAAFYGVQAVELIAGAANIVLLGLNMRDGLRMRPRPSRSPA